MEQDEPQITANRVIKQMIDHSGKNPEVTALDYSLMRVMFRKCGGSWERLIKGSQRDNMLLIMIVTAWCNLPQRKESFL